MCSSNALTSRNTLTQTSGHLSWSDALQVSPGQVAENPAKSNERG